MIGEGNIWRKAMEDDSLILIECQQSLTQHQLEVMQKQFDASLEGTGKRALILEARLKVRDNKVRLHVEQRTPRHPFRVFDQHGRELEGLRVVSVTDALDSARVLQIEAFEIHDDGDYVVCSADLEDAPEDDELA